MHRYIRWVTENGCYCTGHKGIVDWVRMVVNPILTTVFELLEWLVSTNETS